jgi:hypothetical protein
MTLLRQFWTKTYKLPVTSDAWNNSYVEDLIVEFFEFYYQENSDEFMKAKKRLFGSEFGVTGDDLIDFWERQIARGETPDLSIGEAENAKRRDARIREKTRRHYELYGERYKVTEDPEYLEEARRHRKSQNLDIHFDEDDYGSDVSGLIESIPVDAFDDFVNQINAIKKGK